MSSTRNKDTKHFWNAFFLHLPRQGLRSQKSRQKSLPIHTSITVNIEELEIGLKIKGLSYHLVVTAVHISVAQHPQYYSAPASLEF